LFVSQYRHNTGEDNADAHLRSVMGREVVAITDKLDFGLSRFYGEFDGRRKKRVLVNHRE
jgi:thiamine phosphate synthase YjbQ (UPF0047 family)